MLKPTLFILLLVASIFAFVQGQKLSLGELLTWAQELKANPMNIVIYVFFSILVCFVNIPLGVLAKLTSGWIFGFGMGVLISHGSILVGSWLAFRTARYLGKDFVERKWSRQMKWLNRNLSFEELVSVVRIRIFPLIPLPVANFCLGVTNVSDSRYVLGSAIGMLPATCFYAFLGSRLKNLPATGLEGSDLIPYYMYVAIAIVVSFLLPRRGRIRNDSHENPN